MRTVFLQITEIHYRKILNMDSQRSVLGKKSSEKSMDVGAEPWVQIVACPLTNCVMPGGFANLSMFDVPHL